jgi:hypothetical protein
MTLVPPPRRRGSRARTRTVGSGDVGRLLFDRLSGEVEGQDARTGLLLTAVAFFLAGGVAAVSLGAFRNARFEFSDGSQIPVPLLCLAFFLILQTVAAVYLVLSLGPPEPPLRNYHGTRFSLTRIVILRENDWEALSQLAGDSLSNTVDETYERDARYLQDKAVYKYQRLVEARASLLLSLPFFLLAIWFGSLSTFSAGNDSRFTFGSALGGGCILWLLTFVACNDRVRIESHYDVLRDKGRQASSDRSARRVLLRTSWGFPFYAMVVFLGAGIVGLPGWAQWIIGFASLMVLVPQFLAMWERWRADRGGQPKRALDRIGPWWVVVVGCVGFAVISIGVLRIYCLVYCLAPLLATEGIRLLDFVIGIDPALEGSPS